MNHKLNLSVAAILAACFFIDGLNAEEELKIKIGEAAPNFSATASDGNEINQDTFKECEVIVLIFTCNHCPLTTAYVDRFNKLATEYDKKGVALVAINNSPVENLEKVQGFAKRHDLKFVYAYEGEGNTARAFGAKVTNHVFILDKERKMAYQGAFDDNWQDAESVSANFVVDAVNAILEGKEVPVATSKPVGCTLQLRPPTNESNSDRKKSSQTK